MLNKATSADEVPTPGYVYTEIARATADINVSQQVADFLLRKLERDNPHVKVKVLKIIKHVCEQGKPDFRRSVQRKSELVKSCLQYRGTPDPLKGDSHNKAVRDEAEATVKALFSSDSSTNAYGFAVEPAKKMTGFGSDTAGDMGGRIGGIGSDGHSSFNSFGGPSQSAYGGGPGGGGGMVGFGNPNFDNAPRDDKDTVLKQAASSAMSFASKITSKVQSMSGSSMGIQTYSNGPDGPSSSYRAPPVGMNAGGYGSGMQQDRWGASAGAGPSSRPPPPSTSSSGEYEARVVNELCVVGGARAAPPAKLLEEFGQKCASLDSKMVADQLRQKMEQQDWQVRLKALYGIEVLAQQGLDGITGHICQYSSELIFECQQMPQCRQKATKVLYMLGFIDSAEEQSATRRTPEASPPPAVEAVSSVDLLSMDDDLPAVAPSAAFAKPEQEVDFFGDGPTSSPAPLTNGHTSAVTTPASCSGLFDNLTGPSTTAPPPATSQTDGGMFGNLSMKGPSNSTSHAPPSLATSVEPAAAQSQDSGPSPLLASLQFGTVVTSPERGVTQGSVPVQDRTAHLGFLSGGMASQMPAQMPAQVPSIGVGILQGNQIMPGYGFAPPQPLGTMSSQQMGMPPQGYTGGHMPHSGVLGGVPGIAPQHIAAGTIGTAQQQPSYASPMGGMAGAVMPQAGMYGGFTAGPAPPMPMATAAGGDPMSAAPGSAFGFIGAASTVPGRPPAGASMGLTSTAGPAGPGSNDLAFGFVADQMKGATN